MNAVCFFLFYFNGGRGGGEEFTGLLDLFLSDFALSLLLKVNWFLWAIPVLYLVESSVA